MKGLNLLLLLTVEIVIAFSPQFQKHHVHRELFIKTLIFSTKIDEDESRSTKVFAETVTTVNPRHEGLALALDEGTRKSHSLAENTAFVSGFFKGLSTKNSYRQLITSLYYVYEAMEDSFDMIDMDAQVKELDFPELRRVESLREDMGYFYGDDEWKITLPPPTLATKLYVDRIREIANSDDRKHLLIAHQYSRYLGDLFGGQMMSGMATRSLDLVPDTANGRTGVRFYNFKDIPNTKDFITKWYQRLNSFEFSKEEVGAIVDEANFVFNLNIGIFEELDGNAMKAAWTLLMNSLKSRFALAS